MVDMAASSTGYQAALARLPDTYATALRFADAGMPDEVICSRIGIEYESLAPLLDLARRKLHRELTQT
ncbi:MAG: hypothetical protein QOJ80_7324 [Mycobacterium sp.]|jgi:DNA-directed RNA polymerase specialized sigma24 family protein|nr:hypothetical protein [Mycobacterium sp.]